MVINVLRTGQMWCFGTNHNKKPCTHSDTIGQDARCKSGIELPRARFRKMKNGTVHDKVTNLYWLYLANEQEFYENDNTDHNEREWFKALDACNKLCAGFGGLKDKSKPGDWRLPNVRELTSLINYQYADPALSSSVGNKHYSQNDPFHGVQNNYYWTSTTNIKETTEAFVVNLAAGTVRLVKKDEIHFLIPVKG